MAREKSRIARELLEASRPLAKDCEAMLAELAGEFPLALASSGSRSSVDAFLKWTGSRSLFRSILSGEDVGNAKPDPEIYVRSAERLGLDARECLVVEDALAGVAAARAAGCPVVAMAGTCSAEALLAVGADRVIADLSELAAQPRPVDPACWTAVIPAAGRGTRLGFSRPKILYPLGGRAILDWLLDFLVPNCASLGARAFAGGCGRGDGRAGAAHPGTFCSRHTRDADRHGRCGGVGVASSEDATCCRGLGRSSGVAAGVGRNLYATAPRTAAAKCDVSYVAARESVHPFRSR